MLKNYFKTALRNFRRNKAFSMINIMGLALGLACSLFIFLWVNDEYQMDQFNTNSSQLYTVYERQFTGGKIKGQYNTPGIMAGEMKKVLPQVQYACSFINNPAWSVNTFQVGDRILKVEGGFAGPDFFKMFSYKLIEGSATSALNSPSDIAISNVMADNFFGSPQKAIGKTIRFNNKTDFQIAAVFETPQNASIKFDYLINWPFFLEQHPNMKSWNNTGVNSFVMLRPHIHPVDFQRQLTHFLDKYADFDGDYHVELGTQRFDEIYLHADFNGAGYPEEGRIEYVRIFSIIAIFILLIACINFMNLTTASSIKRAKEIGVRKVMGAFRISLIGQFIGEAVILVSISMVIALVIVVLLLPAFNTLTQKQVSLAGNSFPFWLCIILMTLATGVLSGSYPALYLSSFNPVKVLKGTLKGGGGNTIFRKGLVVSQFALSIMLIIGTLVVSKQVNFIKTKNLGFDRANLIYIPQEGQISPKYELYKTEALKKGGIESISRISYQEPSNITDATWGIDWEGKDPNLNPTFNDAGVGYDFAKTMNIHILQGHDFSKGVATDSIGYILNQAAVREIGYKDPIGKRFTMWGRNGTIVGVIKDFNFNSLHSAVNPLILYMENNGWSGTLLVKTQPGKTREALASLEKLWKEINPAFPFTYQFADGAYNKLYNSELMVGKLSSYFSALAIFISCLGLLGLVMFTAEQRTKEIGVRKVLGASAAKVFGLLCKGFLKLVLTAFVIAAPIASLSMSKWLQGYAYHTTISWWIFPVAGGLVGLIALATVSFQAIKTAMANPVKSLRIE